MTKNYQIIKTDSGVFFGEVTEFYPATAVATLTNVRRLWSWGGFPLSQMASEGIINPDECKFTGYIPEMTVLNVVAIISCTDEVVKSIKNVKEWRTDTHLY